MTDGRKRQRDDSKSDENISSDNNSDDISSPANKRRKLNNGNALITNESKYEQDQEYVHQEELEECKKEIIFVHGTVFFTIGYCEHSFFFDSYVLLLFIIYYLLFVICYLLFVIYFSLLSQKVQG